MSEFFKYSQYLQPKFLCLSENLVNLAKIREMRGDERIENALSLAKKHFKIPKLIQAKGGF